jgi:hypothetical protein
VSSLATAPGTADRRTTQAKAPERERRLVLGSNLLVGAGVATGLLLLAFLTTGGSDLGPNTWAQIGLVVFAATLAVAVLLFGARGRPSGATTVVLFAALAALTFASIAWSVQPATSWVEANRTLSYFAAFAGAAAAARLMPGRWPAVAGAVGTAATVIAAYALLVKVFPGTLDAGNQLARLRAPFDYWNATGLAAAMGLPCALWAGARRNGGRLLAVLSMPAIAVLVTVLVLSGSRGALLAAAIGVALWLAVVPLRLRATLVLAIGVAGGAAATWWALEQRAITSDFSTLAARTAAGHRFGVVLLIVLAAVTACGGAAAVAGGRAAVSERARRRIGLGLLVALAFVPVGVVAGLAGAPRGLGGELSHAWNTLISQNSSVNNSPGRLAQLGSSRPGYWSEGLKVGDHALLAGTGALGFDVARTRYTANPAQVGHAHSFLVETFADFGLIGVALTFALLIAWGLSVRRIWSRSTRGPESAGLFTLLAVAVVFGVQGLIDWTWFIPGVAVPAVLCAGWLAGRGPLAEPVGVAVGRRRLLDAPGRSAAVLGVVTAAVLAAWMVWQPLRSANADAAAVNAMIRGDTGAAIADARSAAGINPLAIEPLSDLAAIYTAEGNHGAAHAELQRAVARQPANPATWEALAQFDVQHNRFAEALGAAERAAVLDRGSPTARQLVAQATAR